jgi:hypothetical protein
MVRSDSRYARKASASSGPKKNPAPSLPGFWNGPCSHGQQIRFDFALLVQPLPVLLPMRLGAIVVYFVHPTAAHREGVFGHWDCFQRELGAQERTVAAIAKALEKAGVEFIPENGGGVGVRLAKRTRRGR